MYENENPLWPKSPLARISFMLMLVAAVGVVALALATACA